MPLIYQTDDPMTIDQKRKLVGAAFIMLAAFFGAFAMYVFFHEGVTGEFQAMAYDENGFDLAGANGYSLEDAEVALRMNLEGLKPAKIKIWKVIKEIDEGVPNARTS